MLLVLLVLASLAALAGTWGVLRHLALTAWDRELELAFAVGDRRDMPTRRVL